MTAGSKTKQVKQKCQTPGRQGSAITSSQIVKYREKHIKVTNTIQTNIRTTKLRISNVTRCLLNDASLGD